MDPIIRASALKCGYRRKVILSDVSFEINAGERWFLLGHNGAGKSTLVQTLLGRIKPLEGEVCLGVPPNELGIVPQRCEVNRLLPTTVREFASLGMIGLEASERKERLLWALDRCGLNGRERTNYLDLSGGEKQRALLARAVVRKPKVLVLDEPTESLDYEAREDFMKLVRRLNHNHSCAVLFVTHDLELAYDHATHIALLHHGRCYLTAPGLPPFPSEVPPIYRSIFVW